MNPRHQTFSLSLLHLLSILRMEAMPRQLSLNMQDRRLLRSQSLRCESLPPATRSTQLRILV